MAPKTAELVGAGWSRRDAEHLVVVELALSTVLTIGPEAGAVLAGHAATALAWEPVQCGAYALYTDAEHAAAWRALAGYLESPMRTVMLELAAYADGASVEPVAAGMFTAEDLRLTELARQAESRGDFAEARRLLGECRRPLDDSWLRGLDLLLARGDAFTPAQWGRWICGAALRWCQTTERGLDLGVHYAGVALRALGADDEVAAEHAPRRAGYDQAVHDSLLFDEGGLEQYLQRELAPGLADRVPGLASWPSARLAVLRLVLRVGEDADCQDVLTGERFIVGDEWLGAQHPPGRLFAGRLVRVDGDDRWFFAMLPTVVEGEGAATELAEAAAAGAPPEARIDIGHRWLRQPRAA
jgi:hypothetical protein